MQEAEISDKEFQIIWLQEGRNSIWPLLHLQDHSYLFELQV